MSRAQKATPGRFRGSALFLKVNYVALGEASFGGSGNKYPSLGFTCRFTRALVVSAGCQWGTLQVSHLSRAEMIDWRFV